MLKNQDINLKIKKKLFLLFFGNLKQPPKSAYLWILRKKLGEKFAEISSFSSLFGEAIVVAISLGIEDDPRCQSTS
jgi:hypothetical protein